MTPPPPIDLGLRTASPCISVCRMDAASGLCEGCLRTIDEIAVWSRLDPVSRDGIWQRLDERRADRARRGLATPEAPPSRLPMARR
jgi:uncharacterized protein